MRAGCHHGAQRGRGRDVVAGIRMRLGGRAWGTRLMAASDALAAVGRGPYGRPLPQRSAAPLVGRAVGVGFGEVAEVTVRVDYVAPGIAQHAGGFGGVNQVVRVSAAVDLGQRLDLAATVRLVPGGPLVFVPVVRPADPPGLFRMPVRARSRYQPSTVVRGTPRAAMSARLIPGRPLMAGMGLPPRCAAPAHAAGTDLRSRPWPRPTWAS